MLSQSVSAPPVQASTTRMNTLKLWRCGSWAIVGGYTLALCYRLGLVRKVLPSKWYVNIVKIVDSIKQRTEPLGDARKYDALRSHLLNTYKWATIGVIDMVVGASLFKWYPYLPMSVAVFCSLMPATIFLAMPAELIHPLTRQLCFHSTWLAAGYTCGPLAWIAQDSLSTVLLFTGCTLIGFCIPLFLTRGVVSYIGSAHLLSCALSTTVTTWLQSLSLPTSSLTSEPSSSSSHSSAYTNADINVLLTAQVLFNVGISVLHTIPTIYRFIIMKWDRDYNFDDPHENGGTGTNNAKNNANKPYTRHLTNLTLHELLQRTDPMKEAFCIDAGWLYVVFRITKYLTNKVLELIFSEKDKLEQSGRHRRGWHEIFGGNPEDATDSQMHSSLAALWRSWRTRKTGSGVISSIMVVIWYIKVISFLQKRGNPQKTLDFLRKLCVKISPFSWVLPIYSSNERHEVH